MRWDAAVLSHPDSDLSADDTSLLWGSYTLKCNCRHNPVISAEICLKYQQGVSCHPRIICQIWSLKNIKHILNTVRWTRSVFNRHSSDKLSLLYGIPFLISILIMGILSLMVRLCFMAFQMDGEAFRGITQTCHVIRSHAALVLTKASRMGEMEGLWASHQYPSGLHLHQWELWCPSAHSGKLQKESVRGPAHMCVTVKVSRKKNSKFLKSIWGRLLWLRSVSRKELLVCGLGSETTQTCLRPRPGSVRSAQQKKKKNRSCHAFTDTNFNESRKGSV